jgi:hypothetical protein
MRRRKTCSVGGVNTAEYGNKKLSCAGGIDKIQQIESGVHAGTTYRAAAPTISLHIRADVVEQRGRICL